MLSLYNGNVKKNIVTYLQFKQGAFMIIKNLDVVELDAIEKDFETKNHGSK